MQNATKRGWSGILTFGDSNCACQINLYSETTHIIQPELGIADTPLRLLHISEGKDNLYLTPKTKMGQG
jgi:hypothetical protein